MTRTSEVVLASTATASAGRLPKALSHGVTSLRYTSVDSVDVSSLVVWAKRLARPRIMPTPIFGKSLTNLRKVSLLIRSASTSVAALTVAVRAVSQSIAISPTMEVSIRAGPQDFERRAW